MSSKFLRDDLQISSKKLRTHRRLRAHRRNFELSLRNLEDFKTASCHTGERVARGRRKYSQVADPALRAVVDRGHLSLRKFEFVKSSGDDPLVSSRQLEVSSVSSKYLRDDLQISPKKPRAHRRDFDPTEETLGGAYDLRLERKYQVPSNLGEAANLFKNSESAKNLFGETFVKHFANTRIWEFNEFQKNKNFFDSDEISLWELDRYFEII